MQPVRAGILPPALREGETFAASMCNPPFFETMEEAGRNPATAFGGTAAEMVCPGGERAFVLRMVADSVALQARRPPSSADGLPTHAARVCVPALGRRAVSLHMRMTYGLPRGCTACMQGRTCACGQHGALGCSAAWCAAVRELRLSD